MNEKQIAKLIRKQRPEPPMGYEERMEARIASLLERERAVKRGVRFKAVLAAAVLLMILTGTALAMNYPYIMEYFSRGQIRPLDGAQELIQTDFGVQETEQELVQIVVEEAVFDGKTAVVQLLVSPTNPEEHALFNMGYQDYPESVYDLEITERGSGTDIRVVGRKDGKRMIHYSLSLDSTAGGLERDTLEAQELENGSVRVWLEGKAIERTADQLELIVSGKCGFLDELRQNGDMGYAYHYSKEIVLSNPNRTIAARLTPVGESGGERFEILSAWLENNPLSGQLTIEYAYDPDLNNEPMGIDFRLYDADGNRIAIGSGSETDLGNREDGWELLRSKDEVQAFEQFPERVYLEAKVIGKEQTLGRLEFYVEEATEEELNKPEPTPENIAEKNPVELIMKPVGSWDGEHIRLLEGSIGLGRIVEISFVYHGEQADASEITVHYKDTSGNTVGAALNSVGVVGQDSFTLTETLDGSGWPIEMVLEFEMDGAILDVFTVEFQRAYGQ